MPGVRLWRIQNARRPAPGVDGMFDFSFLEAEADRGVARTYGRQGQWPRREAQILVVVSSRECRFQRGHHRAEQIQALRPARSRSRPLRKKDQMIFTAGKFGLLAQLNPFRLELRSNLQEPDRWLVEYAGGHPTASGQTMTERTAMQLSAVWCAVGLISDSLANSQLCMSEKLANDDGRRRAEHHPPYALLHDQPNVEGTATTFMKTLAGHFLLWGNGYAEIERNGAGEVVALWPLRPDRTFPRRNIGPSGKGTGKLVYVPRSSAAPA